MKDGRSLRVLQVVDTLGMGGAETWLMEMLRLWSKTGDVRMDFLATSGQRGIFDEEATRLGAEIHYIPYARRHLLRFAQRFRQLLKNGRYDAIHDHQDYASGWHFLIGAGVLPPVRVTHVHNPWLHIDANYAISPTRRLTATIGRRLAYRLATHVCGTSEEILHTYKFQRGDARGPTVATVHCGFEIERFNGPYECDRQSVLQEFGWAADAKIVLFAGRLDRELEINHPQNLKNSWFALNVVRLALAKEPRLRLLMAGAGDDARVKLQRHVQEWGLGRQFRLIGVRNDMPRLMRSADALFFPSTQEGLGMVAVEAQAACLPVLASSAVPREAIVIPELFDALRLDEPNARWADALLQTVVKPRPTMEQCRQALLSSPFSIVNSAQRLEEIYKVHLK
jgi:glycosyltransferase involved in cell wall biosynthesis